MVKRPIDSFVKYFLDVKPYHTKILEIVERYLIDEDVNISIKENIFFTEEWGNEPLCKGVGYGLDFDDDCGFSSLSCCDIFDCIGGYGLIFDNSDLLVDATAVSYNNTDGTITVAGDRRYDSYYQIDSVTANSISIRGNHVSTFAKHALFVVVPKSTYLVQETVFNGFYIAGNVAAQFIAANEFNVIRSTANDDVYSIAEVTYFPDAARTFIEVNRQDLDANALGQIIVDSGTKNNGAYQKDSVIFNGTHTVIYLHPDSQQILMPNDLTHGSVVLRTGFIAGRRVWLDDGQTIWDGDENTPATSNPTVSEAKIVDVAYNEQTQTTAITINVANNVVDIVTQPNTDLPLLPNNEYPAKFVSATSTAQLDFASVRSVQLRGYYFGAGFDGLEECTTPKPYHVYANISEYLYIQILDYSVPAPTPSPTPPVTPTPTVTPTYTPTPTPSPSFVFNLPAGFIVSTFNPQQFSTSIKLTANGDLNTSTPLAQEFNLHQFVNDVTDAYKFCVLRHKYYESTDGGSSFTIGTAFDGAYHPVKTVYFAGKYWSFATGLSGLYSSDYPNMSSASLEYQLDPFATSSTRDIFVHNGRLVLITNAKDPLLGTHDELYLLMVSTTDGISFDIHPLVYDGTVALRPSGYYEMRYAIAPDGSDLLIFAKSFDSTTRTYTNSIFRVSNFGQTVTKLDVLGSYGNGLEIQLQGIVYTGTPGTYILYIYDSVNSISYVFKTEDSGSTINEIYTVPSALLHHVTHPITGDILIGGTITNVRHAPNFVYIQGGGATIYTVSTALSCVGLAQHKPDAIPPPPTPTPTPTATPTPSPVSVVLPPVAHRWRFEADVNDEIAARSTTIVDSDPASAVTFPASIDGKGAIQFRGYDYYNANLQIAPFTGNEGVAHSYNAWVYVSADPQILWNTGQQFITIFGTSGGGDLIQIYNNNPIYIESTFGVEIDPQTLLDKWTMLTYVYNPFSAAKFYIDGVFHSSGPQNTRNYSHIGSAFENSPSGYYIDSIEYFESALSDGMVAELFSRDVAAHPLPLTPPRDGYYQFPQGFYYLTQSSGTYFDGGEDIFNQQKVDNYTQYGTGTFNTNDSTKETFTDPNTLCGPVFVSNNNGDMVRTTTDGINWTNVFMPSETLLVSSGVFVGGYYYYVINRNSFSSQSREVARTQDHQTFETMYTFPSQNDGATIQEFGHDGTNFYIVINNTFANQEITQVGFSANAISWTLYNQDAGTGGSQLDEVKVRRLVADGGTLVGIIGTPQMNGYRRPLTYITTNYGQTKTILNNILSVGDGDEVELQYANIFKFNGDLYAVISLLGPASVVIAEGNIYRSTNGGTSWTLVAQNTGIRGPVSAATSNGTFMVAGSYSTVIRGGVAAWTTNGTDWTVTPKWYNNRLLVAECPV